MYIIHSYCVQLIIQKNPWHKCSWAYHPKRCEVQLRYRVTSKKVSLVFFSIFWYQSFSFSVFSLGILVLKHSLVVLKGESCNKFYAVDSSSDRFSGNQTRKSVQNELNSLEKLHGKMLKSIKFHWIQQFTDLHK